MQIVLMLTGALVCAGLLVPVRTTFPLPALVAPAATVATFVLLARLPHDVVLNLFDAADPRLTGDEVGLDVVLDPGVDVLIWCLLLLVLSTAAALSQAAGPPGPVSTLAPTILAAVAPLWAIAYTKDEFFYSSNFGLLVLVLLKTSMLLAALNVAVQLLGREVTRRRDRPPAVSSSRELELPGA